MAKDLTKLYSRPGAEAYHVFEDDNGQVQVKMGDRTAVTAVPSDQGNVILINGDRIYLGDAYSLPPGTVRITATQIVIGHPIGLRSVICVAGSAITLTLYDNGTVGAGNKLYEKAMSAGDKIVSLPQFRQ